MCAAPGSKTAQLIEMLHENGKSVPSGSFYARTRVANGQCLFCDS